MAKQYLLLISKSVAKDLQDLQPKQYKQVVAKILSLGTEPIQQDCKALKGIDGGYRADQGEFRILYYIQEATNEQLGQVQIFRVGKRNDDEVYRNLWLSDRCYISSIENRIPALERSLDEIKIDWRLKWVLSLRSQSQKRLNRL